MSEKIKTFRGSCVNSWKKKVYPLKFRERKEVQGKKDEELASRGENACV